MQNLNAKLTPFIALIGGVDIAYAELDWTVTPSFVLDKVNGHSAPFTAPPGYQGNVFGPAGTTPLPVGSKRFAEDISAATGIRRTRRRPGRPVKVPNRASDVEARVDFGF